MLRCRPFSSLGPSNDVFGTKLSRRNFVSHGGWRIFALVLLLGLAPALRAASESFRFAWLSDIHVGSATGEQDLRDSVRDINSLTGLAFVVISGDITEYGSRAQLRLAHELLNGLVVPCHVIPGNHDTKWSESGATDFARLWQSDRFVFNQGGYEFIGLCQGPLMKMGDGHWAPEDVRWLEETLRKRRNPEVPLIFVTHYPLDDGIANWYVVLDLLKKHNVQAILCGHGHTNQKLLFEGVPAIMCRSNLRTPGPKAAYNLVEIAGNRLTVSERPIGGPTQPPWHSIVLEKHNYGADTNHYPRPDFAINQKYPNVTERWSYDTAWTIASSPAVCKDLVCVGDASGTLYALDLKTGKLRWKFKTASAIYSTPACNGDKIVFASTDGNIYALDHTGREVWRYSTERPIVASPVIADQMVYIGSSEGQFRALDLNSGKLAWHFDGLGGFVETRPLVVDGKVIFGAWDQHLYALDARTGRMAWKWRGGDRNNTMVSPAACWPVASDGKVFVVAPDRKMTAIDLRSGNQVWRTGDYQVRESIGMSEDQSRIYVRGMNDSFYSFAATGNQLNRLWETNAHFGYDINSSMLVEKDGVVFYGTKNSMIYALNPKTGAIEWQHKVGVGVMNTIVPINGTEVLTTDFDGKIALIAAKN